MGRKKIRSSRSGCRTSNRGGDTIEIWVLFKENLAREKYAYRLRAWQVSHVAGGRGWDRSTRLRQGRNGSLSLTADRLYRRAGLISSHTQWKAGLEDFLVKILSRLEIFGYSMWKLKISDLQCSMLSLSPTPLPPRLMVRNECQVLIAALP